MDSDSDSDGSHVSATPPRDFHPPPPPPRATKPRHREPRAKPKSANAKPRPSPNPKPKPKPKPKSKPSSESSKPFPKRSEPDPPPIPIPSPDLSSLPFQIRRPSETEIQAFPVENSVPAGGFGLSKFASFSKIRRPCPVFTEEEDPNPAQTNLSADTEGDIIAKPAKVLKRHPNLIGGTSTQPAAPVKKPKCVNEGNFVRLNINGYGSNYKPKTKFKGQRKSYSAYNGRRSFQPRSRKRKDGDENGNGSEGFGDEEGLGLENHQLGKKNSFEMDEKLLEETVSSVRGEPSDENLLQLLKLTHGYDSFRDGQLEAIKMILSGKSTMLVLPTGAGKSLCYQLPAMVLPGVTLVVSPLVALMIDQLRQLPLILKGGLLSSSQTPDEMSETLQLLHEGTLKVLFVSPERFLNAEFISVFSRSPIISLVVVDEAHCVSEWSHNFRPSYMRLRASLLQRLLNVQCILAMTATATPKTLDDVMCALEIPPTNIIKEMALRDNLQLSVTSSRNRLKDLMTLIKSKPFVDVQSIIIYCKYQSETDSISKYLRDSNISAMSYHSGVPTKDRKRIQDSFCSNKIRVVVATVAFGMGLDKSDVGAIIHYTLPESLEEYVQEIGRAGRDGRLSYCHLLFDDTTYFKLRSLTYSDGVDEYAVSRFLSHVFAPDLDSNGNIHSLAKESASRKFDMKEEVMLTILTQLELGEVQYLRLLPQINTTCTLNFHNTAPTLLAAKDNSIAAILKKSDIKHGQYVFDVPTVANCIRISAIDLLNRLHMLKAKGEITFEMKDQAYCYTIMDVPKDICSLTSHLTKWLSEVESCKVRKIDAMFDAASFAVKLCKKVNGCNDSLHTACLQKKIAEYFSGGDDNDVHSKLDQRSPFLRADMKVFLQSNSQAKFTPRAIARIMHGISSPVYPASTWSKTHFWGRYATIDFQAVMDAAKAELMNFVGKNLT